MEEFSGVFWWGREHEMCTMTRENVIAGDVELYSAV